MDPIRMKERWAMPALLSTGAMALWLFLVHCLAIEAVAAATLVLVLATLYLAYHAAKEADATRMLMFVQATLSLYELFEKRDAREDRKRVYEEVIRVGGKYIAEKAGLEESNECAERAALEELKECVERVAAGFDYLGRLMEEEDRLRDLAIRFYGIPAIKSWAVVKPYVGQMIKVGRRQSNFHEAFRKFAETAAKDEYLCDLPGIQGGHEVWIDSKGEIIKLSIWDEDNTGERDQAI